MLRQVEPELTRSIVVIFVSASLELLSDFPLRLTMVRPTMPQPLHFGIRARGEPCQAGDQSHEGVTVLGGWGLDGDKRESFSLIYAVTA